MVILKLTDGADDAAVFVASPIQGGQVTDGLLGQLMLQKDETLTDVFVRLTFLLVNVQLLLDLKDCHDNLFVLLLRISALLAPNIKFFRFNLF